MKAAPEKISEAEALNVRIIHGWAPVRAEIHRDNRVSGVYFKHCDRLFDENGHDAPIYNEHNTMAQYCDTIILADE